MAYSEGAPNNHIKYDNICEHLINELKRLDQESPRSFSKPVHALPAINDTIEDQLERQLSQERGSHSGKRIILIPCLLENSYWIGIVIEFEEANHIIRAEYINPVNKPYVIPYSLQQQLSTVYPSNVFQIKDLSKHDDRAFSAELTIKNLLAAINNDQRPNVIHQGTHQSYDVIPDRIVPNMYSTKPELQNKMQNENIIPTSTTYIAKEGNQCRLDELQQELKQKLETLKVQGINLLPKKIEKTEQRIKEYEEEKRVEDVRRETEYLHELQRLQNLVNEIANLSFDASVSENDNQVELRRLKQELSSNLAKLNIQDEKLLPQKIQKTEQRIKEYEEEKRVEDVRRETEYLHELQKLQNLVNEIAKLSFGEFISGNDNEAKLHQLKQMLSNNLAKMNIQDEKLLPQKIQKIEQRIKEYEEEERIDDAKKETEYLHELQRLQNLVNEIANLSFDASVSENDNQVELRRLKQELSSNLAKLNIQDEKLLPQLIQKTERRIKEYEEESRIDDAKKEREYLDELQKVQNLINEISKFNPNRSVLTQNNEPHSNRFTQRSFRRSSTVIVHEKIKQRLPIENLHNDLIDMPQCAEKTIMELLEYFEEKLLDDGLHVQESNPVKELLNKLYIQIKTQDLFSEEIQTSLQELSMFTNSGDNSSTVGTLHKLLQKIRPLNVYEIQRLISKAREAATLIHDKEIVLFIGATGSGKSTTIQFLSGADMRETKVEIAPRYCIDHITSVGPNRNPGLNHVISNPHKKSETRYIAPVIVPLKDILGAHETGMIILCDAPGFGDTAGAEVDIANSVGVFEALQGTKSVKLLVLSSYEGLGDRGEGIQKLAHRLINMMHSIDDKLKSVVYAFTKYPKKKDIKSLLLDIKLSKVDQDLILRSDTAFCNVLTDMIKKTETIAYKIDPIHDDPKILMENLRCIRGIQYPKEVFRFSMSQETRASITNHVQRDQFNIICAMKHKNYELILHYLKDLKILQDLIKQSSIRDAYKNSIQLISENINEYCTGIMKKFNRALASQDGLTEDDIHDYKTSVEHLQQAQILKEHLESSLLSPETLMQNINSELHERTRILDEGDLYNPLVRVYLNNLLMLKNSFKVFEMHYRNSCEEFEKRFNLLEKTALELILTNDFQQIAEIILKISKSSDVLKDYLGEQIEESYYNTVKVLLKHLRKFSEKTDPLLQKHRLTKDDIEILKNNMDILNSAKENSSLQDRVSTCIDMIKKKAIISPDHNKNWNFEETIKDLHEIHYNFIQKIMKYFDEINSQIEELFRRNKDHALDDIQKLVEEMNDIRTIQELGPRTAETYHRTVENIRGYMQQLHIDAEQLLFTTNHQTGTISYRHLAQSLSRLKNAKWFDRVSPGEHDALMRRITEELVYSAGQLEERFIKLDFTLKNPDNVSTGQEIVAKIESMRDLEYSIPELEKYRNNVVQRFFTETQIVFDRIQKTFNLQNRDIYRMKQELKNLEEIKRECDNLHPARIHLREHEYSDIATLHREIEELKNKQKQEVQSAEVERKKGQMELENLNSIKGEYMKLQDSEKDKGIVGKPSSNKTTKAENYLKASGYSDIRTVYNKLVEIHEIQRNNSQQNDKRDTDFVNSLNRLESILKKYDSLLAGRNLLSSEAISFLREKNFTSYESLVESIQEKIKIINEHEKNKQPYHFYDSLDAFTANNALIYVNACEKVGHDRIRENATDTHENLQNYIREYGNFLNQEINRKFNLVKRIDVEGGPFQHSQDLELRLDELLVSLNKFTHVFDQINGNEKVQHWRRIFSEYYRTLDDKMKACRDLDTNRELNDQLTIAHALSCIDRFFPDLFAINGFGTLYRQYQRELNKEFRETYKTVLDHISKGDYAKVDIALSNIHDRPLNSRDKTQIQHDLQNSLNKLMNNTKSITNSLDGKIEREDNQSQIKEIKDNIDKVRIALNEHNILNLLNVSIRKNLESFEREINETLANIILKGLRTTEAFMNADSFSEAEQGMENLSRVQRDLTGYCTSTDVINKSEELQVRLNNIVNEISNRNDVANVTKYYVNPPKILLNKLQMAVSRGSARFTQVYNEMLEKVTQSMSVAINDIRTLPSHERSTKIRLLNNALCFLPEDLKKQFESQIDEISKQHAEEERVNKQSLELLLGNLDGDDQNIIKLRELAEKYKKENMIGLFETLRAGTLKKLCTYRINVKNSLDNQDIHSVILLFEKITNYKESLGTYLSEIEQNYNATRTLILGGFSDCCKILSNISSTEQITSVEKAFSDILIYFKFFNRMDNKIETENELENVEEGFQKVSEYLNENSKKFQSAVEGVNTVELSKVITIAKKWDKLLQNIYRCQLKHDCIKTLLRNIKSVIPYNMMITELEKTVNQLKSQLNVEFISDETTTFEGKREEFFINLMKTVEKLRAINLKLKDVFSESLDMDKIEGDLREKIDRIGSRLISVATKGLTTRDATTFRTYYYHLQSFEKHVRISAVNIRLVLENSEEKILEKVKSFRREIMNSSSDAVRICEMINKMKFLAENLSMFDMSINHEIDEALTNYKRIGGALGIIKLTVELEKTDLGSRVISEHSCLMGEVWRKRREKMQKQDDIDYILENLTGDDISTDVLRSRYATFRRKYDELISNNLNLVRSGDSEEPDVKVIISQIKYIIGTVTHKHDTITWDRSFRDEIPVLLAHIFAVWTLQNTQHYNTMRGIDKAQWYLLMPHVGQVIAIFRLLATGYETHKRFAGHKVPMTRKISDELVNNLVEVGTGEGKSVVMAITACVFALVGVDVNCSCYSEVLSARDKNDFASVFRALEIEDRIEYGTFNKLCEQLLNEQCNVREKVRDMIANNQSALTATDTSTRMRPKVLLIDEVDVFLSEKFYGGTYTPSVYLKDPTIKALLDSIWENKTLNTLNKVKALPAYKICATKYSNWIFLFDEAIKDMIAALKSFQSSTYIVQKDRIVYVEGESIADNVARGYDTIWAYYHEHENRLITWNSLNENVGIILNCGTFSYAEIHRDFAYIAGVTGTLKTLASAEKEILKKVYEVDKMTYMPSVFGSSNRTYNSANDVRAVKESEYFMEIRGEIDSILRASRAIFIFFESEEKLQTFYDSLEQSMKQDVKRITEQIAVKDRELYIKHAATIGKVTLLTRTFGRGTDFICHNEQLEFNGGVHVLQTFFSEELSEEYQIMGRGARQGDHGSYRMILLDKDLEWVLGSGWKEDLPKMAGTALYIALNDARNVRYESKCGAKQLGIEQCRHMHKLSKQFMNALITGNMKTVIEFLTEQNKGANLITASSRTLLLMDATGSMSNLLTAAKETVCTMFERASTILQEKGLPNDAFQMQFAVYRNYNSTHNKILEVSSWETKASNLRAFMKPIRPEGGIGSEAIEIGLWHAAIESETHDGISQVILIGDAPANTKFDVTSKRTRLGEDYWKETRFATPTYYKDQLQKLKHKNIPIHAFYLADYAKANFQEIASETSGRCELLDIYSPQGAELLTNFVTEEVLRKSGGDEGDAMVVLYREKYNRTFTS